MKQSIDNDKNTNEPIDRLNPANLTIRHDVTAQVKFDSSNAAFHNTVGMYTYDSQGNVTSTSLLFGDVSASGVTGGASAVDLALKAGDHIGFFIAPNAATQGNVLALLKEGGSFHLVDTTNGQTANVNSGHTMQLAYDSPTGQWSNVHTQYWTSVFTSNANDNGDGLQHVKVTTDPDTGKLHVKFEDQVNNGDHSFANGNFTVTVGRANAEFLAKTATIHHHHDKHDHTTSASTPVASHNGDTIDFTKFAGTDSTGGHTSGNTATDAAHSAIGAHDAGHGHGDLTLGLPPHLLLSHDAIHDTAQHFAATDPLHAGLMFA